MDLGFYLLPILIGYFFLTETSITKHSYVSVNGYRLVFSAALVGLVFWWLAYGLIYYPVFWIFDHKTELNSPWLLFVGLLVATVVALLCNLIEWLHNHFVPPGSDTDTLRITALENGDLIGIVLDNAWNKKKEVEVILKNREVYVGRPIRRDIKKSIDIPNTDLVIYPALIGYQDINTLEVKYWYDISNLYFGTMVLGRPLENDDSHVTISRSEIVSVKPFNLSTYRSFKEITESSESV